MRLIKLAVVVLAFTGTAIVSSQDWPMWGGTPHRNLFSTIKNLPSSWDVKTGKNIKWKVDIGSTSYGNPVIADGKIFLGTNNAKPKNSAITGDKGVLMCFRESDGKFLWQAVSDKLDRAFDSPEQGVCSSPAVEGKRLYYVTNRGELICLDTEGFMDGKNDGPYKDEIHAGPTDADIIWKLDMMKELKVSQRDMANSSPVIWGNLVFVETSNGVSDELGKVASPDAPSFIAVDKNTGKPAWKDKSPGDRILFGQWASAAIGDVGGVTQAFFPGGDGLLYGFDARTGQKIWSFDLNPKDAVWPKTRNYIIATPVFYDGKIFLAVGQEPENGQGNGHMYCIDPSKRGDITESGRIWHYDKIGRTISTAAIAGGLIYISDYTGFLHCLDVHTGKPYWTFDMLSSIWGSPLAADGKVYIGNQDGAIFVFQMGKEQKKIAEIDMGDAIYGTPVAANGVLYIMTSSKLYAISN
jgi:outer membrane protein assembly factor BamB